MREIAEAYTLNGWAVHPLKPQSKIPFATGWQNHTTLTEHKWGPHDNIGVVLGDASGGLVDVDLDRPEALPFAKALLPPTLVFGRPGNPSSHWLYYSPGAKSKSYKAPRTDGTKACYVELRSNGAQTVLPPSIHTSGELIDYDTDRPPTEIPKEELSRLVAMIAMGACLRSYWPETGVRHDVALAVVGLLCRNDYVDSEIERFMEALTEGTQHNESWPSMIRDTRRRLEADEPVRGIPTIRDNTRISQKEIETLISPSLPQTAWREKILRHPEDAKPASKAGKAIYCPANFELILENDTFLKDLFWRDEFTTTIHVTKTIRHVPAGPLTDDHVRAYRYWMSEHYPGLMPSRDDAWDHVQNTADLDSRHPVRDYLRSCGELWDGTERLPTLATDILNAAHPISNNFLRKWLLSAVRRVFEPGTKVDTVLVLKGTQGYSKSSFLAIMAGAWFDDTTVDLHSKDANDLSGIWVKEFGELADFKGKDNTTLKNYLSRAIDQYRPPYARTMVSRPRHTVFAGSTNSDTFLTDETGNRRYWPIYVTAEIDLDRVRELRDQIWGEVYHLYRQGESHVLEREHWALADEVREEFEQEDPLTGKVEIFLQQKRGAEFVMSDLMDWLEVRPDRGMNARLGWILKDLGVEHSRRSKRRIRYYSRPVSDENTLTLVDGGVKVST